ncbi:MAG TPA: hypothetical protein VF960_14765, partial [Chloroflexota bacterium]
FDRGLLLWTADHNIYALLSGGSWERFPDSFETVVPSATPTSVLTAGPATSSTGTPTATPTSTPAPAFAVTASPTPTQTSMPAATPSPTSTPTTRPTSTPTSTPAPGATTTPTLIPTAQPTATPTPQCAVVPVRGLGLVYDANPTLATRLGCAQADATSVQIVRETFERGLMMWRSDTKEIVVIRRDGDWTAYKDTYVNGEVLSDVGTPPAGLAAPVRSLGKVWRQTDVRQALGWATGGEQQLTGSVQEFANGRMIWTADKLIYALVTGGSWQSFVDSYPDPTPTPTSR